MMRAWRNTIQSHWRIGLALLAPILAFHWKIVLLGHWIQGGDFINQFAPWRHFALSELREGRFPFWNPYVFCGTPFAANIQTSLFYPENILHLILPVEGVFSISLVVHQALAALTMYGFLYYLLRNKPAAAFGALAYAWSGFLVTHAHDGHLIHVRAYALIPLALWMQSLAISESGGRAWAGLAGMSASLAMMFYAGHTQAPLYVFYVMLFRAVWLGVMRVYRLGERRLALIPLLWTGTGLALSLATAMMVLLPLAELSQHTAGRAGGAAYEFAVSDSMPPSFLVSFVAPLFYGDPTHPEREQQFWLSSTGYHELCGYTGVLALLLLAFAFLPRQVPLDNNHEERQRRWDFYFFLALAAGGLFFALGDNNPLYPLLYYGLPGWSYFRVPARLVLLFILGVCVCSAWGLAQWQHADLRQALNSMAGKCAVALSCLLPLAWLLLWLSKPGILAWLRQFEIERTVETFGWWTVPRSQISAQLPESLFETRFDWMTHSLGMAVLMLGLGWLSLLAMKQWRVPIAAYLPAVVLMVDVLTFSHRFIPTQSPQDWKETYYPNTELVTHLQELGARVIELDDAIGHPGLIHHPELRPNRLMGYGVASARGYDPLILERYARHVNRLYGRPAETPQGGLLFFSEPPTPSRFSFYATAYVITTQSMQPPYQRVWETEGDPVRVYHFSEAHPAVYWENSDSSGIDILSTTSTRMELRVQSDETRRLIWSQVYYPSWRARLNGAVIEVDPHEDAWISVEIPPGEFDVIFFFNGAVFLWGALISVAGALVLALILVYAVKRESKKA